MATSATAYGLRLAASPPYDQAFAGMTSAIHTDTDTQPTPGVLMGQTDYFQVTRPAFLPEARNVQVQTRVFRTDYESAGAAGEYKNCYITVKKSAI